MVDEKLREIIRDYETVVRVVDQDASDSKDRAYGGYIRATKGRLQEYITDKLIRIAWQSIGGDIDLLEINSKKIAIPIRESYIARISEKDVSDYIRQNIKDYVYKLSVDKHIFIDGEFVMAVECKSFAENAMIKRILIDFDLLKTQYPNLMCYLFQLESQLGGDYCELTKPIYGSRSTRTIQSYFKCDLKIITLLSGERKVKKPIHKHFKELTIESLKDAMEILATDMKKFL